MTVHTYLGARVFLGLVNRGFKVGMYVSVSLRLLGFDG
jgi:hypothetical protein